MLGEPAAWCSNTILTIKKYSFDAFYDKKSKIYFNRFILLKTLTAASLKYLIAL